MKNLCLALSLTISLVGCSASLPKELLDKSAFIRAGSTNIWSAIGGGSSVSLTAVDGIATNTSNGPVSISPGKHRITMSCAGKENVIQLTVAAGEIYEYAYGASAEGCFGGLIKVN